MDNLRSYFWYSLLSSSACCELVLNITDDVNIDILKINKFYDDYERKDKTRINTSEESRLSVIKRTLSLCKLMAKYNYYPSESFYYLTNDQPGCKLLVHVPRFDFLEEEDATNITAFIHFVYTAPFYTTQMEDLYLQNIGCSDIMIAKLKNRTMGLDELCDFFTIDKSESLLVYKKPSKLFNVYKEDKCVKDLASVLWESYVSNNTLYKDEVRNVSVERRKVICMNLSRYLLREELVYVDDVDERDQIRLMILMVISRDVSCFPNGFK